MIPKADLLFYFYIFCLVLLAGLVVVTYPTLRGDKKHKASHQKSTK